MPRIEALNIFPIKGMRGISVKSSVLEPEGFQYDRRWMLVDGNGVFISQRSHSILTQFIPTIHSKTLVVQFKNKSFSFRLDEIAEDVLDVSVFDDSMKANRVSNGVDQWFSTILDEKVSLVKVSANTNRIKDFAKYVTSRNHQVPTSTTVGFADGYPYLILGTASMNFLNAKMVKPLEIARFRANIIVTTQSPHEEDTWDLFKIGDQQMIMVRPCARCQVPTIDQLTGARSKEPNTTLSSYRVKENKIYFGMNAVSLSTGTVAVGDLISF